MAEQQFYTLITNVGQAKLANATALGTKVNFVKVQVGDGRDYNPNEAQESLKHKVWEGNINNITIDSKNPNWIVIQTLIPASVGGFNISEVGVFDDEGNMLIVSKYPETYKPKLENGSGKDLTIKLVIQVSNTENVTLKIDPSITIATKEDIRSVEKQIGNIKVPVQSVNGKAGKVTLKAEDITAKDGTNLEKFKENVNTQYEDFTKEVENLKSHVDNGKNSLYSAIVGKKVTPRSKDFSDLAQAISDIKLGQGNAQASQVLNGRTFTNDSGIMQTGTMPNMGSREIEPKTYVQELGKGYYNKIKINSIDTKVLQNNFPNLKPENIAQGVEIGGIIGIANKIETEEKFLHENEKIIFNKFPKCAIFIDMSNKYSGQYSDVCGFYLNKISDKPFLTHWDYKFLGQNHNEFRNETMYIGFDTKGTEGQMSSLYFYPKKNMTVTIIKIW